MLVNWLNKKRHSKKPQNYQWWFLLALPIWAVASYFTAQLCLIAVFWLLSLVGSPIDELIPNQAVFNATVAGLSYILTLAIVIGVPYFVRRRPTSLKVLGLDRLMGWTDIGLTPLAYIAYALIVTIAMTVVMYIVPEFQVDEKQNVGFQVLGMRYEYVLAFLTLVVVGPIAEEIFFRGYLYGKLRAHVPLYAAMLVTAMLFAAAHGQWNVAIDTFVLSIVLTGLREVTGSIWAGILVHMMKNSVAFYALFIAPTVVGL